MIENTEERKPIEKATFAWSDNRIVGIAFLVCLPLILLLRVRIGIRVLRVDIAAAIMVCLSFIANLSDWIRSLPLIGSSRQTDMALWRLFIWAFGVMFVIHLIRAYREAKRNATYTYTRSLGHSRLWKLFQNTPIPFIKKQRDFKTFIEPCITLVGSIILAEYVAPNLGTFLALSSIGLFIVQWQIRSNMLNIAHDANDAAIISDIVIENDSDDVNDIAEMASGSTASHTTSADNSHDGFI